MSVQHLGHVGGAAGGMDLEGDFEVALARLKSSSISCAQSYFLTFSVSFKMSPRPTFSLRCLKLVNS